MKKVITFTVDSNMGVGPLPGGGRITSSLFEPGTTIQQRVNVMALVAANRFIEQWPRSRY